MKNQETNNKDNSQETGCTFFFKNGTTQFVPDANFKELKDTLKRMLVLFGLLMAIIY